MHLLNRLLAFLSFFLLMSCAGSSLSPNTPLPFDPNIERGTLDNGLRYYLLTNRHPKDRLYIRLVVNAGSMNEDEDQRGVAHIVEHMAFNGTKRFPENTVIQALETLGMKFARDINAFTDFENTVYTLNLSRNDPQKLALAFDVINEWMNHLTILPQALDAERGIVLEEWRARLSPMLRLGDKKSAFEMAGSRYVLRDPIGDVNVIKNVSDKRVKDFYQKWYRPDNMALIVVGDVDTNVIKTLIEKKLNHSKKNTPLTHPDYRIPLKKGWRLETLSEAGIHTATIELSFLQDSFPEDTVEGYRKEFIQQLLIRFINLRLQQWEQTQNAVDSANFYQNYLGKSTLQTLYSLQLSKPDYKNTVDALFQFIAQLNTQGFQQEEFNAEIQRLKKLNQKQLNIQAGSLKLANDFIPFVANQSAILSPDQKYRLNTRILSDITLEEVNQYIKKLTSLDSKLLLITQPHPANPLDFNIKDLEKQWQMQQQSALSNHNDKNKLLATTERESAVKSLPVFDLPEKEVIKVKHHKKGNISEFRLENGSRLIYHYSDKQPGQVHFKALTSGGLRSVNKADYHLLRTAATLVDETGIGTIPQSDIKRLLADHQVVFSTLVDDIQQGFVGIAKGEELEILLKLFRLKLQSATISPQVWEKYRQETIDYFNNMDKETTFMRHINKLRYPNTETAYTQNLSQILNADPRQLAELYHKTINGKTNFTYFIIGDIKETQVVNLARRYLANLDVKSQVRSVYPVNVAVPSQTFRMTGLKEPRSEVEIHLTAKAKVQPENLYVLDVLADVIEEKLRLSLREKESGIYSVGTWITQDPFTPQIEGEITFSCDPQRTDHLLNMTHRILDDMANNGINPALITKKAAEKKMQIKQQFDSLLFVSDRIEQSYRLVNSPKLIYLYEQFDQIVTKQNVDNAAKTVLAPQGRFSAILTH